MRSTSLTEARMVVVRSRTLVMSMPCGMEAFRNGNWLRMRSTVWMMFAPGWRKMITVTDRYAVQVAGGADVLHGVDDLGHVGEPYGRPLCSR